jgi:hypothetical protein
MDKINTPIQTSTWSKAIKDKLFIIFAIISSILLASMIINVSTFLNWVETRPGVVLNDPILRLFAPVDISWFTFVILHIFSTWAIIVVFIEPHRFFVGVLAYSLLVYLRILTMWLVPLNAPNDIIILQNPFMLLIGTAADQTKDLFFSGHTASMFLTFLVIKQPWLKGIMLAATIIVASCVLIQHVHYTIDVVAAPFFTYSAFCGARYIHNKIFI